jgi:hypothetical protein
MNQRKRNLKPRAPIIVSPSTISQLTCEPVLGVNPPRYLATCIKHPEILRPVKLGRLVLTKLDGWERLMEHLAEIGAELPEAAANDAVDDGGSEKRPATADDFLARIGLKMAVPQ